MASKKQKSYSNIWKGNEIVRWVADSRTRRVPTFVIEKTGLKTKAKINAKYGVGAVFDKTEKGSAVLVQRGTKE